MDSLSLNVILLGTWYVKNTLETYVVYANDFPDRNIGLNGTRFRDSSLVRGRWTTLLGY